METYITLIYIVQIYVCISFTSAKYNKVVNTKRSSIQENKQINKKQQKKQLDIERSIEIWKKC